MFGAEDLGSPQKLPKGGRGHNWRPVLEPKTPRALEGVQRPKASARCSSFQLVVGGFCFVVIFFGVEQVDRIAFCFQTRFFRIDLSGPTSMRRLLRIQGATSPEAVAHGQPGSASC